MDNLLKEYELRFTYLNNISDRFWQLITSYIAFQAGCIFAINISEARMPIFAFNIIISTYICLWIIQMRIRRKKQIERISELSEKLEVDGYYGNTKVLSVTSVSFWFIVTTIIISIVWTFSFFIK